MATEATKALCRSLRLAEIKGAVRRQQSAEQQAIRIFRRLRRELASERPKPWVFLFNTDCPTLNQDDALCVTRLAELLGIELMEHIEARPWLNGKCDDYFEVGLPLAVFRALLNGQLIAIQVQSAPVGREIENGG